MVLDAALRGRDALLAVQSGRVQVFDWMAGTSLTSLLTLPPEPGHSFPPTVSSVAVSPGRGLVAVAASDGKLRLLEPAGKGRPTLRRSIEVSAVQVCRFLDDERLLLGEMTGEVALLDLEQGQELYRRQLDYDPVYDLAVSPDGDRVAVAFRSSRIQIVRAESAEMVRALEGHRDSVYDVAWLGENAIVFTSESKEPSR